MADVSPPPGEANLFLYESMRLLRTHYQTMKQKECKIEWDVSKKKVLLILCGKGLSVDPLCAVALFLEGSDPICHRHR